MMSRGNRRQLLSRRKAKKGCAVIAIGEIVHIIERRRFDTDVRRHFVGAVEQADATIIRVVGYTFVYDHSLTRYVRASELRTRIIPLSASGLVINIAPADTQLEEVRYEDRDGRLIVTDGGSFNLDINEFGRNR